MIKTSEGVELYYFTELDKDVAYEVAKNIVGNHNKSFQEWFQANRIFILGEIRAFGVECDINLDKEGKLLLNKCKYVEERRSLRRGRSEDFLYCSLDDDKNNLYGKTVYKVITTRIKVLIYRVYITESFKHGELFMHLGWFTTEGKPYLVGKHYYHNNIYTGTPISIENLQKYLTTGKYLSMFNIQSTQYEPI